MPDPKVTALKDGLNNPIHELLKVGVTGERQMNVIVSSLCKQRVNISLRKIFYGKTRHIDPLPSELFSLFDETQHFRETTC